jgi:hypothetical protein
VGFLMQEQDAQRNFTYISRIVHKHAMASLSYAKGNRNSSVGIATRYGLGLTGIESRSGARFSEPSRPARGLTRPPAQWVPSFFAGG